MSEASGHLNLWTEPQYPGDSVRVLHLRRGRELGHVCIQQYDQIVRVASFLPGYMAHFEDDSMKTIPEKQMQYRHADHADAMFDAYVQEAYRDGWQNYHPELPRNGHKIT